MIVVQLSDPHIVAPGELLYDRVDTAKFLARSVAEINRLDPLPDVAVMTGDLVDHGNPAEYEHLHRLLAPLAMPIFVIPGNHDAREPLRVAFAGDGYLPADGFLQFTIEDYPVRLVALDTLIPGEGGGLLCSARLAWLDHVLASAPARPVLLMMHHPPFLTGIERMDRAGLQNSAAFAAVVARHPQVERILCGHLHRAIDRRFAGTVAGTAPSTAHQLTASTSLPKRRCGSCSNRLAISSMCGARTAASSPTPRCLASGRGLIRCARRHSAATCSTRCCR